MVRSTKGRTGVLARHLFAGCHRGALFIMPPKLLCACGQWQTIRGARIWKSLFPEAEQLMLSHGRPHTSNDNRLLPGKYIRDDEGPGYLSGTLSVYLKARGFLQSFGVVQLRTSAFFLDLLTPYSVHYGIQDEILERRNNLPREPLKRHPERFRTIRSLPELNQEVRLKHRVTLKKWV